MAKGSISAVIRGWLAVGVVAALAVLSAGPAAAQVLFVAYGSGSTVGAYSSSTGAPINASFISGLTETIDLATDRNNHLFVGSINGTIGKYDLATGAPINPTLVPSFGGGGAFQFALAADGNDRLFSAGPSPTFLVTRSATTGAVINSTIPFFIPLGLAVDGDRLFVSNFNVTPTGAVTLYDANSLALLNIVFVPPDQVTSPRALVVGPDNRLLVAGATGVGAYDATTGTTINRQLVTGLTEVTGIAVDGNRLFVANGGNRVSLYDATSGALINPNFVTGLSGVRGLLAVSPVPEPSSLVLASLAAGAAVRMYRRRRGHVVGVVR